MDIHVVASCCTWSGQHTPAIIQNHLDQLPNLEGKGLDTAKYLSNAHAIIKFDIHQQASQPYIEYLVFFFPKFGKGSVLLFFLSVEKSLIIHQDEWDESR